MDWPPLMSKMICHKTVTNLILAFRQILKPLILLVGTRGFEPRTPWTPFRCASRLRYVPAGSVILYHSVSLSSHKIESWYTIKALSAGLPSIASRRPASLSLPVIRASAKAQPETGYAGAGRWIWGEMKKHLARFLKCGYDCLRSADFLKLKLVSIHEWDSFFEIEVWENFDHNK